MTKSAQAKSWTLSTWSDGTKRSWAQPTSLALKSAADALTAGAFGTLTESTLTQELVTQGLDSGIMPYCKRGCWDPVSRRAYFFGGTHDSASEYLNFLIYYDDSTDAWAYDSAGFDATGNPTHGYWHFTLDPATGTQYGRVTGSSQIKMRARGGIAWTDLSTIPGTLFADWNQYNALEWFPDAHGGAGALVFASGAAVYLSNAAGTSWTDITPSGYAAGAGGESVYGNYTVYSLGAVYTGGGVGGSTDMWRIAADGTVAQVAATPILISPDKADGLILAGTGTSKLAAIESASSDAAIYEYDATADSWSASIGTVPFDTSADIFAIPIADDGCVIFVTGNDIAPSTTMRLWKR
ncbi:MAG: hypothetical protein ACREUG_08355 [Steroidobacteraceae bacterium]